MYTKRAGLGKHVHPHLLRHSRATHLANVLTEAQMREFFGWTKRSQTPAIYVHLSGRDVDRTLLKHYGIEVEEAKRSEALEPVDCPRCQGKSPPWSQILHALWNGINPRGDCYAQRAQRGCRRAHGAAD